MARCSSAVLFAGLSMLLWDVSASAETLRCQSVNGNLNCAGSGGASCQTVDGKTVCVSGHDAVVQSFGNGSRRDMTGDDMTGAGLENEAPDRAVTERPEQQDFRGQMMLWDSDGTQRHAGTDWMSIDRY